MFRCGMRALLIFSFLLLCLSSCVTTGYKSPGEYHGGFLLGPGTYLQDVSIEPKSGNGFRFQGVFQRRATGVMITGLSPFGTTVFRIKDTLVPAQEPSVEIFVEEMKPHRDRFVSFYKGLRPLLLLEDKPAADNPLVKERYPDRRPKRLSSSEELSLLVEEYDWEGHAFRLSMSAPQFTAKITLREYTQEEP
jgi:hypothetical protein